MTRASSHDTSSPDTSTIVLADAVTLLDAERADTRARAAGLSHDLERIMDAAEGSNADDEHDPEGATLAFERAQVAALLDQASRHLHELDDAAARVAAGTYGTCRSCAAPIAPARLRARPAAATCIGCASRGR